MKKEKRKIPADLTKQEKSKNSVMRKGKTRITGKGKDEARIIQMQRLIRF